MKKPQGAILRVATDGLHWVDQRLAVVDFWNAHLAKYYAPKNFNFWYFFGSLAMLVLVNQIMTENHLSKGTIFTRILKTQFL